MAVRDGRLWSCGNLPSCLAEHLKLVAQPVRVSYDQSRSNDVEGGINVHRVRVLKRYGVYAILVSKVTPHPLNTHEISDLHVEEGGGR